MTDFLNATFSKGIDQSLFRDETFNIRHCVDCDFYWHEKVLTDEYLNLLYSEWLNLDVSEAKQMRKTTGQRLHKIHVLFEALKQVKTPATPPRVLDFGGGWSTYAVAAKGLSCEAYLLEGSERKLAFARAQGITAVSTLAELKDEYFDVIVLNEVLEHVPNPVELLQAVYPKLKPGGCCLIATPNAAGQQVALENVPFHPLEHVNGFTPNSLAITVEKGGLTVRTRPSYTEVLGFK